MIKTGLTSLTPSLAPLFVNSKTGGGGGNEPGKEAPLPQLSYNQINKWSEFVEKNPHLKNMDQLWPVFEKLNPGIGVSRDVMQKHLDLLMRNTQETARSVESSGDGGFSYLNTGRVFPKLSYNGKDYGRVNSSMQTEIPVPQLKVTYPDKMIVSKIPDDITDFWWDEEKALVGFEDPRDGVIKYAKKSQMNTENMKKLAKTNADKQSAAIKNKTQ